MGRGLDRGRRAVRQGEERAAAPGSVSTLLAIAETALVASSVSCEDIAAALRMVPAAQRELDGAEVAMIEQLQDGGWSLEEIAAAAYNGVSRQSLQTRYVRIGGRRMGKPGRRHALGDDQRAAARASLDRGGDLDEVAAELGVAPITLRRNLGL